MTWSLRISNGDLVLDGTKFETVSGENKLFQDLRCYLLERMGTDPLHRTYGSLLDGGVLPSGKIVPSPIARTDWRAVTLEIESEIRRVAAEYQNRQLQRAKEDRLRYGRSTLAAGEILAEIGDIRFTQEQDTLRVQISVQAGNSRGTTLAIDLPAAMVI